MIKTVMNTAPKLYWLALLVIIILMQACDSSENGKTPAADSKSAYSHAADGELRKLAFITLRNRTGSEDPQDYFGDERNSVHTGFCNLRHTPNKMLKPFVEKVPFYVPENKIKLDSIRDINDWELWRELQLSSSDNLPMLYVHGFNIGFDKGCRRASLFQENLRLAGRLLLFSWPSDGAILNYTRDEADLYWSVAGIEKTLTEMIKHFGAGGFDIVAHSLGTRGVFLALVQLSHVKRISRPLLNELVLIAPDIDADTFRQYLPAIRPLARNITIYVSENDSALTLSQEVHGYPRLGKTGPHLQSVDGVDIIDITETGMRSPSGHLYQLYNRHVINDLDQLLNQGKSVAQRANLKQLRKNYWQLQSADKHNVSNSMDDMNEEKSK